MSAERQRLYRTVLVFALLLVYFVVMLEASFRLDPEPQLVPLIVVVPAIVLTSVRILTLVRPDLLPVEFSDAFGFGDIGPDNTTEETEDTGPLVDRRTVTVVLWILGYVTAIFVTGLLLATMLFVTLFLYHFGEHPPKISLPAGLLTTVAVWLVFVRIVHVRQIDSILFRFLIGGY